MQLPMLPSVSLGSSQPSSCLQEFGLHDDVEKFSSELARIERLQAAATEAPSTLAENVRTATGLATGLTRLTAQRPATTQGTRNMPGLQHYLAHAG